MTRYPAAETFAKTCRLPLAVCPATKELYGYATPVLDVRAATRLLNSRGFYCQTPAFEAALHIMHERAEELSSRPGASASPADR